MACLLLCALALFAQPADAARRKPAGGPAAAAVQAPIAFPDAPPAGDLQARLAWAGTKADALRAVVAAAPRDDAARAQLASLAILAAADLEQALARGDPPTAAALRALIEKKLHDTRWRLGEFGRQGAGGGYYALGVIALHGILGPRDPEIACQLFGSAWDKGYAPAAWRLSECTSASDAAHSATLLRRAAADGNPAAREALGRQCLEARPADLACAAREIEAAAAAGRASAKTLYGWMLAQGAGVPRDAARALALYVEAARDGDLPAKNNLGELYETGRGVPADATRAAALYREAAEAGFAAAQFNLGRMFAGGTGVAKDFEAARAWLEKARAAGVPQARTLLDWIDAQTAGTPSGLPPR